MNLLSITLIALALVANSEAQYGASAPKTTEATKAAATCKLQAGKNCASDANKACTEGGTTKFAGCRKVFTQFCENPKAVSSVESCLAERCDGLTGDKYYSAAEFVKTCRKGLVDQCAEQSCSTGGGNAATCKLQAGNDCDKGHACTDGKTTQFVACRKVFKQFCKDPEPVASVEACLKARCDHLKGDKYHSTEQFVDTCRKGVAAQCAAQVCADASEPKYSKKVDETGGVNHATCKLKAGTNCDADHACTDGKTTKFVACRKVFKQFCENPEPVSSVELCLKARCDHLTGDKYHSSEEFQEACRVGLAKQCKAQVCTGTYQPKEEEQVDLTKFSHPSQQKDAAARAPKVSVAASWAAAADCEDCTEFEQLEDIIIRLASDLDTVYTCISNGMDASGDGVVNNLENPDVELDVVEVTPEPAGPPLNQVLPPDPLNPDNLPLDVPDVNFYIAACNKNPRNEVACNQWTRAFKFAELQALTEANALGIELIIPSPKKADGHEDDYGVVDVFKFKNKIPPLVQQLRSIQEERQLEAKNAAKIKAQASAAAAEAAARAVALGLSDAEAAAAAAAAANDLVAQNAAAAQAAAAQALANAPRVTKIADVLLAPRPDKGNSALPMYFMRSETGNAVVCVDECANVWPPVPAPAVAGDGVTGVTFGDAGRPDGSRQLTVNGRRAYFFNTDINHLQRGLSSANGDAFELAH